MLKKIFLTFIIVIFSFLINSEVFSASVIPIENVFLDIKKDYIYYNELQTLYNKGIIEPEEDHMFHPDKLLDRDEFVGIAEETSCKKCIIPKVEEELVSKYKTNPFYDVGLDNKYFYCISDAKDNSFVLGYNSGAKCNDGTQKDGEIPFCTNNNIKLEEALAVVMRMGGILTDEQASETILKIKDGENYPDLALDLKATNIDGTANSFYPYFEKALEYEVVDYDNLGNKKTYKLIEKQGDYFRPDQQITKQDFLKMAFVALKANSCIEAEENNLAIKINIFDKDCNLEKVKKGLCNISDLQDDDNIFDFDAEVGGVCDLGIDKDSGYIWRFYNKDTGLQVIKYGKFIDNYNFLTSGKYLIFLRITDNCGNTGEVYNTLNISNYNDENDKFTDLGLQIEATPLQGVGPLEVDLRGIVEGGVGPYKYEWDLGDGTKITGEDISHIFTNPGTYEVTLIVTDSDGNTSEAMVTISVLEDENDKSTDLGLQIEATPLQGVGPLEVDLRGIVEGGVGPYKYEWDLGDGTKITGEDISHIFTNPGTYEVTLIVTDSDGNKAESVVVISVLEESTIGVSIGADPIFGPGPLEVDLEALVEGGVGPYDYIWDFGDGTTGEGKILKHIFVEQGVYEIELTIIDRDGNTASSTILIDVSENICSNDSDLDGINDCLDKCPLVKGVSENGGCPIFIQDDFEYSVGECLSEKNNSSYIFGNVVCSTCPCDLSVDFRAELRDCDTIIPAITSVDEKDIFARGNLFQFRR